MKWLIVVCAVGSACDDRPTITSATDDPPKVFAARCAMCHGTTGKPPTSMVAQLGVRDLTDPDVRARLNLQRVEEQVRKGSSNKLMPGFELALTEAQITAVSAWVVSPQFLAPR